MNQKTSLVVRCIVLASVFALWESRAHATLLIGYQFATGGNSVTVPVTGGTYTVNVIATTDNAAVTGLGLNLAFWGAFSTVLNGNLGNATLDGDITAHSIPAAFLAFGSLGDINDNNADSRDDLGPVANTSTGQRSVSNNHPWWAVSQSASMVYFGASSGLIGTFTVTIPAYTPNANSGDFLRYSPQLHASSLPNYDIWAEIALTSSTNRTGKFNTAAGDARVNPGSTITFAAVAVPEPATLLLLTLGAFGLLAVRGTKSRARSKKAR